MPAMRGPFILHRKVRPVALPNRFVPRLRFAFANFPTPNFLTSACHARRVCPPTREHRRQNIPPPPSSCSRK